MKFKISTAALLIGAALAVSPALAHGPAVGPNGGPQAEAGDSWHAELVANGTKTVTVHLTDGDHKALSAKGFKANAIFVVDGKPQRFTLEPADGSKLVGTAPVAIPKGAKGALQLTAPDGKKGQAKF